jgi:hypothetical protein
MGSFLYAVNIISLLILAWAIYTIFFDSNDNQNSKEETVVVDGVKYKVGGGETLGKIQEPKPIKSLGSKLVCEVLSKVTGKPIYSNMDVNGMENLFGGTGGKVDCSEPLGSITVDYHNEEYYTFNGPNYRNGDILEYYSRIANDEYKKDQLIESNVIHIDVPYTVDMCEDTGEGKTCSRSVPLNIRRERIERYLRERLTS